MRSPNNKGDGTPIDHLLSTNEGSGPGTGIHPIELPAKGSHENPQTTQDITKIISCLPQTGSRNHCCRKHPHYSLNIERSSWCLHRTSTPVF